MYHRTLARTKLYIQMSLFYLFKSTDTMSLQKWRFNRSAPCPRSLPNALFISIFIPFTRSANFRSNAPFQSTRRRYLIANSLYQCQLRCFRSILRRSCFGLCGLCLSVKLACICVACDSIPTLPIQIKLST